MLQNSGAKRKKQKIEASIGEGSGQAEHTINTGRVKTGQAKEQQLRAPQKNGNSET
jgi:hypothetical protein